MARRRTSSARPERQDEKEEAGARGGRAPGRTHADQYNWLIWVCSAAAPPLSLSPPSRVLLQPAQASPRGGDSRRRARRQPSRPRHIRRPTNPEAHFESVIESGAIKFSLPACRGIGVVSPARLRPGEGRIPTGNPPAGTRPTASATSSHRDRRGRAIPGGFPSRRSARARAR